MKGFCFIALVFCLISAFLCVFKNKKVLVFLISILIFFGVANGMYFFNPSFKQNINTAFNIDIQHAYTVNNSQKMLPLPGMTVLKYRTSDTDAVYVTKTTVDKILKLYSSVADDNTFSSQKDNSDFKIWFQYNGERFIISVTDDDGKRNMKISVY